jgi:hypothetical protein
MTLINTTVSGNSAFAGGGVLTMFEGDLIVVNSTIANNAATVVADALLIAYDGGTVITNTLIDGDCAAYGGYAPTSNGHNLESPGATCALSHPTDLVNIPDLRMGPLADNGGPTLTHALWSDSPAIDSADPASCPADDQRGTPRPVDGDGDGTASCDVGAFELPALGPVGMILLMLLLGGIAVRGVRRQAESLNQ